MTSFTALLANGITAALAGPTGAIEWLPIPRFDGPSVFGRLLDRHGGGYLSLEPEEPVPATQRYLDEGLALETRFDGPQGTARVRTWLAFGRTAVWMHAETSMPLVLTCRPMFNYGAVRPAWEREADGVRFANPHGPEQARLLIQGPHRPTARPEQWICGPGNVTVVFRVSSENPADTRWLAQPVGTDPERVWRRTASFWQHADIPYQGPFEAAFHRSVQVVRALTYRPTGVPIAAATTSLPENPGETRQWDYRFVWVRDAAYAGEALLLAGDVVGARRIAEFLLNAVSLEDRPFAAPLLRVDGSVPDGERDMGWLAGHQDSRPARMGNGAVRQLQQDLAGSVLWLVYRLWEETGDAGFIRFYWWAIAALADWSRRSWNWPDASLWEFRGIRDQHTHSRVLCWTGLTTAAHLAEAVMGDTRQARRWATAAERIRQTLMAEAAAHGGFPQRARGGVPDAALFTLPLYGFVPADDPAFHATFRTLEETLVQDDLVFRYRSDDLGNARFPFTLAGFWYARVLLRQGALERADQVLARHVASATPLGLFGEHVDPESGQARGNFPQLFAHTGLIAALAERRRLLEGQRLPGMAANPFQSRPEPAPTSFPA
ncbi:Glyco_hydro_15 domain-containing protein [Candidatus Hydrogenisulfobacillus filiaventi]|uniref:Glyco_hydro_15 domain-containing protein n=1 Tax=Candidatus Hydrogenisulfobacillus filiaventi TaxID=2707344 RepID=A0A6F8ZJG6_9FIRM|nr:Glyco_hydro_15 domain-containing protein [Candidatus Hydrogenisulfobacillus filiaventi]